ncbi:MAG: hypothetical protein M3Q49_02790 [Actinomycetota bacterium]|nr:hypothetical protein [Actinomycetota bacterium]
MQQGSDVNVEERMVANLITHVLAGASRPRRRGSPGRRSSSKKNGGSNCRGGEGVANDHVRRS